MGFPLSGIVWPATQTSLPREGSDGILKVGSGCLNGRPRQSPGIYLVTDTKKIMSKPQSGGNGAEL